MTTPATIETTPSEVFDAIDRDGIQAGGAWTRPE